MAPRFTEVIPTDFLNRQTLLPRPNARREPSCTELPQLDTLALNQNIAKVIYFSRKKEVRFRSVTRSQSDMRYKFSANSIFVFILAAYYNPWCRDACAIQHTLRADPAEPTFFL